MKNSILAALLGGLVLLPGLSFAQCYTMSASLIEDRNDGELCFPDSSSTVGYHQFVSVRVQRNGISENFNYFGLGVSHETRCVHTKEGPLCHDQALEVFGFDLGFGEVAKITLDRPDLERGQVTLPDRSTYNLSLEH